MPRRRPSGTGAWVGAPSRGAGKPSGWAQGLLSSKSHLVSRAHLTEAEEADFGPEMSEMSHTFLR